MSGWKDIMRKINIGKQLVMEKMGQTHASEDPPEYVELKKQFKLSRFHFEALVRMARILCQNSTSLAQTELSLGEIFSNYGIEQESALGAALCKFGELMKSIGGIREGFNSTTLEGFLNPIVVFLENDLRSAREIKKKYFYAKAEYDNAYNKLKSMKLEGGDPARVARNETKVAALQKEKDDLYSDATAQMTYQLQKKDFDYLDWLCALVDAYYNFFNSGIHTMNEIEPYLRQLQRELQQAKVMQDAGASE